jgi:hypothetical protein
MANLGCIQVIRRCGKDDPADLAAKVLGGQK